MATVVASLRLGVAVLTALGTQLVVYVFAAELVGAGNPAAALSALAFLAGAWAGWTSELPSAAPIGGWSPGPAGRA